MVSTFGFYQICVQPANKDFRYLTPAFRTAYYRRIQANGCSTGPESS
jgi:hypothetical protein